MTRRNLWSIAFTLFVGVAGAEEAGDIQEYGPAAVLGTVEVSARRESSAVARDASTVFHVDLERLQAMPMINAEDALKHAPNLHVRKRYIADNNSIVSVRGTSSRQSARTLVYADGLLLSNLLGSDFTYAPRWSLVSPREIQNVEVRYGPFSARYPGNSIGATVLIHTAMPEELEITGGAQYFSQSFDQYGIDRTYDGHKVTGSIGDRFGDLSWLLSAEHLDSKGHPLSFLTVPRSTDVAVEGDIEVEGAVPYWDQRGQPGYLLGINGEGSTRTINDQLKLKASYDLTDALELTLTMVSFRQRIDSTTESFLRARDGSRVSTGAVAIDGYRYTLPLNGFAPSASERRQALYGIGLHHRQREGWSYSVNAAVFDTIDDVYRTSRGPTTGPGTVTFGNGTGWQTFDAQADLRTFGEHTSHWLELGVHGDRYRVGTEAWSTGDWQYGSPETFSNAFTGQTETLAAFLQDTWSFAEDWKLTAGIRFERWTAERGSRTEGDVTVTYPARNEQYWSPKLSLERNLPGGWNARASWARAYRMPTVSELFQGKIVGTTLVNNDPSLKPERANSAELTVWRVSAGAEWRVSLYEEDTRDVLFSQTNTTVFPVITNIQNVDRVRTRGAELALDIRNLLSGSLDMGASISFNDARIVRNDKYPESVGKAFYRIPKWRADLAATYRWTEAISSSLGLRYSGRQYNTLDNTDINPGTFGGTSNYFVADAKLNAALGPHATLGLGVENLTDERYYAYHPYPGRTWLSEIRFAF